MSAQDWAGIGERLFDELCRDYPAREAWIILKMVEGDALRAEMAGLAARADKLYSELARSAGGEFDAGAVVMVVREAVKAARKAERRERKGVARG